MNDPLRGLENDYPVQSAPSTKRELRFCVSVRYLSRGQGKGRRVPRIRP